MAKKQINAKVDEVLYNKAKKVIPNISKFFNDCLETYLEINSSEFELDKINDEIKQWNMKRELMIKSRINERYEERDLVEVKNQVWSELYANYLYDGKCSLDLIKKSVEVLGQSEETLMNMMSVLKDSEEDFDKYRVYEDWAYTVSLFEDVKE